MHRFRQWHECIVQNIDKTCLDDLSAEYEVSVNLQLNESDKTTATFCDHPLNHNRKMNR